MGVGLKGVCKTQPKPIQHKPEDAVGVGLKAKPWHPAENNFVLLWNT